MGDFYNFIDYLTDLLGIEPRIEKTSENWYLGDVRYTKKRIDNKEIAKFILCKNANGLPTEILSVANQRGYALLQIVHYHYCAPDKFNIHPPKVAFKIYYQWISYRYDVPFEDFINKEFKHVHKSTIGLQHTAATLKNYLDLDINNKDKKMLEGLIRKYSKKNILRTLNESGNTEREQYMIGRLHRRSAQRSATDDYYRRRNISKEFDNLYKYNKGDWSAYDKGYDDEGIDIPTLKNRTIRNNYSIYKMKDMDKLGKQFINFIESDNTILSLIVDYMSGNQNGKKYSSPLPEVIPEFEDNVLGYECTPEMRKAIERSFNEWWNYTKAELMHDYYEE